MVCKAKVYGAAQHPPEVIAQDENNRFVSDAQIQQWTEGTAGQGQFMSMVFMRSATVPATPEGGHWGFTIPDGGLWTNTILPGIDPVFVSTRFFTSDGALPQEAVWRPPVLFVRNGDSGSKGETGNPGTPGIQGPPGIGINGADGVNGKDGTSVVWLGEAMAHPINPEDGFSYRNTADRKSYIYWDGAWYQMTVDGFDGLSGYSNAIVTLYRASLSTTEEPASFSGTFTYDFSTGILSGGTLNGWSQNIPAIEINEVIWARQASAAGNETTDTIEAGEFSGGVVITGSGTNGLNSATVMLFHKNTSATIPPAMPTGTFSYSFLTHVLSGGTLNGWTQSAPNVSATEFLWLIQATASATSNTDGIEHTEFSAPVVIAASGNNGLDIVWKGNLATPPANPVKNWVYRDTDNHIVYIYNGSAWELMVLDGSDGTDGATGTDGLSVFITYHDADPQGPPPTPPTNVAGTNNGWHTNPTANVGWMSQKVDDGTGIGWGLAIPIRGANGNSGPRGSNTFTVDEADANTPNITPTVAVSWAGTLTNANAQAVVRDIMNYFAHDGFLRSNDKITITDKNNQIAGTRVYIGIATNDFTQILASHFSSLVEEAIDGSLIIQGTLSADRLAGDIIAGGQLIGGQLVIGYSGIGGDKPPTNADNTSTSGFVTSIYPADKETLQTQIDGKIYTWFQASDPNTWAVADRPKHNGDIWFKSDTNQAYRYNGSTNTWVEIKNQDALKALEDASTAQDTADGKRRVFTAQPYPPYDLGDLWAEGSNGDLKVCTTARETGSYVSSNWSFATKYTDNSSLNTFINSTYQTDQSSLITKIDGKIYTWFQSTDPVGTAAWTESGNNLSHAGDMWWNTTTKELKRYSGSAWSAAIEDKKAIDAFNNAATAQDTADGKRRVFTTTPVAPYDVGDLWDRGGSLGIWRCVTTRTAGQSYSIVHWTKIADSTASAINAFTEVNSGGLKMTNTVNGDYVEMTPGTMRFVDVSNSNNNLTWANGTLTLPHARVDTLHIANNAVSIPSSVNILNAIQLATAYQFYDIATITYTSTGAKTLLTWSLLVNEETDAIGVRAGFKIFRGDSLIYEIANNAPSKDLYIVATSYLSGSLHDTPPAGSVTYKIQMSRGAGSNPSTYVLNGTLTTMEMKK